MELPTPTFGKELMKKKKDKIIYFSDYCNNIKNSKKNRKLSLEMMKSNEGNTKDKYAKKGNSQKCSPKRLRAKSMKKHLKKYRDIKEKKVENKTQEINDNINSFIRNHKFELRDDFNESNVNKFLSAKEFAFEIPIILANEPLYV